MPDDERTRRRLGDATKNRIADLASGWSVDAPASPEPPRDAATPAPGTPTAEASDVQTEPSEAPAAAAAHAIAAPPTRSKPKTNPPPPPGSPERRALEATIVATKTRDDDATEEVPPSKRNTGAQPTVEPPRPGRTTGSQPTGSALARPDSTTGAALPGRPKTASAPPPTPAASRGKPPTQPPIPSIPSRGKPPTQPPLPSVARSKPPTQPPLPSVARSKPPTQPPPPPGSPTRSKPPTQPPPPVATAHPGSPSQPPPATSAAASAGPRYPRAGYDGPLSPLATNTDDKPAFTTERGTFTGEQRTPAVIVDRQALGDNVLPPASGELIAATPKPVVPIGEFEGVDTRQVTAKRDPAEALLKIPDAETPVEELEDGTEDYDNDDSSRRAADAVDPSTEKFERGDPTHNTPPDATEIEPASARARQHTGGTLRRSAALRRKRGLYGDVRYVFTAVFGVRRSRRELDELEHRQDVRATSRRRHLVTLGRAAASMDGFDHPALGPARDTLALIEDERAKHAGAVAASDAELERVRRDRETNKKAHAESLAKADAEIAEVAKKLEPLEKEAATARKKAGDLRDEVNRIDKKIADTEALLVSVKGEKLDKAGVQADIATYKANKQAVLRDEPVIAAELDGLNPRIAALESTRTEMQKKKVDLDKADQEDQRRTLELLEAIGAKRKVVERASADAETARDTALFGLGERLYVDRPSKLAPQLSPIDRIDLEIGEDERRAMELKEILSNIDKAKFARGLAMIILALGVAGTLVWVILASAT